MKNRIRTFSILICFVFFLSFLMIGCGNNGYSSPLKENESKVIGIVTDVEKQTPIPNVKINIVNSNNGKKHSQKTNSSGQYSIVCEPGYYSFTAGIDGYSSYTKDIVLGKGKNQEDFYLAKSIVSPCELDGKVVNFDTKEPIPGATVQVGRSLVKSDAEGNYKFTKKLPEGKYDCWISAPGFELFEESIELSKGRNRAQFELLPFNPSQQVGSTGNQKIRRNLIVAIDPTTLDDCKIKIVKTLQPSNVELLYDIVLQDRYHSSLIASEPEFKGKIIISQQGCYEKVNDQDWVEVQQSDILKPSEIYSSDIESLLFFFNFEDPSIIITELGKETISNYNCTKFNIHTAQDTEENESFDMNVWIIKDPNAPSHLLNCAVKIKGSVPKNPDGEWYDIDILFYEIGEMNSIEIPEGLQK